MAELGDFVAQGRRKHCEVTLEMMDYKHVDACSDVPELRSILQALKSGEHGKYPHLERHTEKRILDLLPEKDRKKIEALASTPSAQDVADAANDINAFVGESKEDDDRLRTEVYVKKGGKQLPPVRGRKAVPVTKEVSKPSAEELEAKKENRIPGYDFRAWDKYDVDKECDKLEDKEKAQEEARKRRAREARERDDAKARKALEDLAKCRTELGCDDLAPAERQFLARREKNKGNEAYRASENRDAYDSYTRSLAYDASSAVVFANRAMACLRLGLLERAEDDCTCALKIDPSYHKARQRRGMTRHKRGKYALAIEDFERACADDPDNLALRKLLKQACDKFEEVLASVPLRRWRSPRPVNTRRSKARRPISRGTPRRSRPSPSSLMTTTTHRRRRASRRFKSRTKIRATRRSSRSINRAVLNCRRPPRTTCCASSRRWTRTS